jgi:hypothetical protein
MCDIRPTPTTRRVITAGCGFYGGVVLAGALLILVRGGDALAADQAPPAAGAGSFAARSARRELAPLELAPLESAPFTASLFSAPLTYPLPLVSDPKSFSVKDFRPRGRSILDTDFQLNVADDTLINDTTVWQRLSEYRTHGRVRVLTLWESGAGTVSLQAGRKGDPSLQWTSRLMNRGGATRGLLDRLFPVTAAHENTGVRSVSHATIPQQTVKPPVPLGAAPHLGSSPAP